MVNWRGRRQSDNFEDRSSRGGRGGFRFPFPMGRRGGRGGGGLRIPMPGRGGGGMSIIWIIIIVGAMLFFGFDPRAILGGGGGGGGGLQFPRQEVDNSGGSGGSQVNPFDIPGMPGSERVERRRDRTAVNQPRSSSEEDLVAFVRVIQADTEETWNKIFRSFGKDYREPRLVRFRGYTQTRCGTGQSAMGPFYCPLDQTVYIDLAFYEQLRSQFGAPGDFAQAYVIAHEVGHHVQTLLGITEKVQSTKARLNQRQANQLQVRMELQADCLAGVWAHQAERDRDLLEDGDIEEGLRAASAIGDDMIQRRTQGRVVPDAFTHGTSEQRMRWFRKGLETGNTSDCDTFNSARI